MYDFAIRVAKALDAYENNDPWAAGLVADIADESHANDATADVALELSTRVTSHDRPPGTSDWIADARSRLSDELLTMALNGNETASRALLGIASRLISSDRPLPSPLKYYLVYSMRDYSRGVTLSRAFNKDVRKDPEISKQERLNRNRLIFEMVGRAIKTGYPTSYTGDIGPAFAQAAEVFGLSPQHVRRIYYDHKKLDPG